ncbi:unnamed protein product [Ranitomeya imitator]|uniref:Uncharacterized protein n=1 Tax=Ranitomeya imitator TaxID=111125 RepID=A0ABN9LB17_9NEOB|nr:unnamed protein product [Ranitomeya imitator]
MPRRDAEELQARESISCGIVAIVLSRYLAHTSLRWAAVTLSIINAVVSAACTVGLTVSVIITVANEGRTLLSTCTFSNLQLIQISHECPFDPTRIYSTTLCLWVISIILDAAEMVFSARCYFIVLQLMDVHLCHKKKKKVTCFIGFSRLLEALRRRGTTSVPLVDIWVVQDTGVAMDIKGLSSCVDQLTARVQNIQDFVVQNSLLEPRIPIPDLFFGDRTKFLSFKNNCKLFLALKPRSSGDPIQQVRIVISFLRGDPQDWAFSLASGDPALSNIDAFFLALGLLYDEPNSVDQAEKNLLALCQA